MFGHSVWRIAGNVQAMTQNQCVKTPSLWWEEMTVQRPEKCMHLCDNICQPWCWCTYVHHAAKFTALQSYFWNLQCKPCECTSASWVIHGYAHLGKKLPMIQSENFAKLAPKIGLLAEKTFIFGCREPLNHPFERSACFQSSGSSSAFRICAVFLFSSQGWGSPVQKQKGKVLSSFSNYLTIVVCGLFCNVRRVASVPDSQRAYKCHRSLVSPVQRTFWARPL